MVFILQYFIGQFILDSRNFTFFSFRDLKPENILCIKTNGSITLKLADFGLGKLLTEKSQEKLYASSLVGTFTYLPPEIIKGRDGI